VSEKPLLPTVTGAAGKLSEQLKRIGEVPIKTIEIRLPGSEQVFRVGLQLLSGLDRRGTYVRAMAEATAAGVTWDETNAVCALELWVETVGACTFDVDAGPGSKWATVEELRGTQVIGQELLQHIYEAYEAFEQSHSIRPERMTAAETLDVMWRLSSGDTSPLDRMRAGSLRSFTLFLVDLLANSQSGRLSSLSGTGPEPKPSSTTSATP
jgi:hypothetical protein